MLKYFRLPFAILGNRAAVDDDDPGTGVVNYETGYPTPYQLAKTDPSSRNIERDKMNEIFYDITQELQLLQAHGVPDFITSGLNGGTPHEYGIGDRVRYDAGSGPRVYESRVPANTDLPTVAASWTPVYGGLPTAAAGGTANALTVAFSPNLTSLPDGQLLLVKAGAANTGGATLAVDGGAAKPVVTPSGLALLAGDIPAAGAWVLLSYDLTGDRFVLLGAPSNAFRGANQSLTANGFQRLPGGLILQWGSFASIGSVAIVFPVTFPNAVFLATASNRSTAAGDVNSTTTSLSTSGATFNVSGNSVNGNGICYWWAVGH